MNSYSGTRTHSTSATFFSKRIWTKVGLRQCFVLVFLHIGSPNGYVTNCTPKPTVTWMKEQAERFVAHVKANDQQVTVLLRDRDGIYSRGFDKVIRDAGIRVKKNSVRAPNLQAHVERFIQSLQQEALDHFIVFGEKHFDYLVSEYVGHYLTERPHQSMGNVPLTGDWREPEGNPPAVGAVACQPRLGGLLRHYTRKAA